MGKAKDAAARAANLEGDVRLLYKKHKKELVGRGLVNWGRGVGEETVGRGVLRRVVVLLSLGTLITHSRNHALTYALTSTHACTTRPQSLSFLSH